MKYIARVLTEVSERAYHRYRFYLHWRAQERMARAYSPDRLRAIQWRKFTRLLEFAYTRIPFYRDKFRQAGITPESIKKREDLVRIPVLSKDEIRQNFPDRLLDSNRKYPASMLGRTSGSTGESLHFVKPDQGWKRSLYYSLLLRTQRIRNLPVLGLTTPFCSGNTCSLDDEGAWFGLPVRKLQKIWFLRHLQEIVDLPSSENILCESDDYMERIAEVVFSYSPCLMVVDPVYLGSFARYVKRKNSPIPKMSDIITTYELLTGSLKDLLREVFGCDIYTEYGSAEISDIANECEYHELHVRTNDVLLEAIRNGEPAKPGEIGKAIITDLCNYNMPFIRYEIGDVIALGDGRCTCGRNTETIEAVHGRVRDVIATDGPNGARLLTPLQVDEVFRGLRGIASYRLVQEARNLYRIAIVPDDVSGRFDKQTLIKRCGSMFGKESDFRIQFVERIEPLASKKFRFVYSEVSSPDL